jgi:hypothetical protein
MTRTGKRKSLRARTQRSLSSESPPPVTMACTCGWKRSSRVQVWSTIVTPSSPPRRFGSRASVSRVCDALANNMSKTASRERIATPRSSDGSVKTTWK